MAPGEIAVNEVDGNFYYGAGQSPDNSDLAAQIIPFAGNFKQDRHENLSALSGLNGVADRFPYFTGKGALSLATLTSFGRTFLSKGNAADALSALGGVDVAYADVVAGRLTSVANIAALKALDKAKKTSAFVLGYLSANDGGGGFYYYDSSDTTSADNGGTVIVAADGGRWKLKHDGRVTVCQFGALTSRTDNAAYINAAISAIGALGGGEVLIPSGTFNIGSEIVNTSAGVFLRGVSRLASLLRQTNTGSNIIKNTGAFFRFSDISTIYATPPTGGVSIYSSGSNSHFDNFLVRNGWTAMEFTGGTAQKVTNFELFEYEQAGLYAHDVNDIFVFNFIMNAGDNNRGRLGGIRLYNRVEAFVAVTGDILAGVYPMVTDAAQNQPGTRPAYNTFNSIFFDSAANEVLLDKFVENEFIGCWFSTGRSGGGRMGVRLLTCESTKFIGGRFFNNGSHGISISANAKGTILTAGWTSESNSVTAGDGVAHGVFLESGATDVTITDGRAHNGLYFGKQGNGIFVSGGCSALHISGNNLKGNLNGSTIGGDLTGVDVTVSGNVGCITSARGVITLPAGQGAANVTHGLSYTPTLADIDVTCGSPPAAAGVTSWYLTNISSTGFQIVVNATATADLKFGWRARLFGE